MERQALRRIDAEADQVIERIIAANISAPSGIGVASMNGRSKHGGASGGK